MDLALQILKLLSGIGLFLFAMYLIEEALKQTANRNFKLLLQRTTQNSVYAAGAGAIITIALQSSSMVSLLVLAFVGAGVLNMRNAFAVILGANLGSTGTGWLVALLGFKWNLELLAYPCVFAGGLLLMFLKQKKEYKYLAYFLTGFGLLFIGLSTLRSAMDTQNLLSSLSTIADWPPIAFLVLGFFITALVQSSSVTTALTLSALNAGVIDIYSSAAIVIGSETGTTIKIILGAVGGNLSKKRLAIGNFLFNLLITIPAFIFLEKIVWLITEAGGIQDPLIALVSFASFINFTGILLFLPTLDLFTKRIEKIVHHDNSGVTLFIEDSGSKQQGSVIDLLEKETEYFINKCMTFNLKLFDLTTGLLFEHPEFMSRINASGFHGKSTAEKYEVLKEHLGKIQSYYMEFRDKVEPEQRSRLDQLASSARSAMHSVKSMKDIEKNIQNLERSSKDIKHNLFEKHRTRLKEIYEPLNELLIHHDTSGFKALETVFMNIQENYTESLNEFYKDAMHAPIVDQDITTVINFNRELFTSNKAMLMAVKELILNEKQSESFNGIPVYRT